MDEVMAERSSADGRHISTLIERDCGATTDFATLLTLRDVDETVRSSEADVVLAISGRVPITFEWESDEVLSVKLEGAFADVNGAQVTSRLEVWREIRIVYSE